MNIGKRIRAVLGDQSHSLQERLFRLITTIGLCGLLLGLVVGILNNESLFNQIVILAVTVILAAIAYFSLRTGRIEAGAVIISALVMFIS